MPHQTDPITGEPMPHPAAGEAAGGNPASTWPSVAAAETQIHASMNKANIATTNDAGFYSETHVGWHPMQDTWAKGLNPLSAPDPPTVSERCMMDCREREKLRKRECAEIRKRVQAKLKDLGCPSTVKSTDKSTVCGQKKSPKKEVATKKKKPKPKGGNK